MARAIFPLVLGAGLLACLAEGQARTPFDGVWSVSIVTERGSCDRAYRYPVSIVNGHARHVEPDSAFVISGRVAADGHVRVSVRRGSQEASGVGKLSRSAGSGRWRSAECAGYWQAERRG